MIQSQTYICLKITLTGCNLIRAVIQFVIIHEARIFLQVFTGNSNGSQDAGQAKGTVEAPTGTMVIPQFIQTAQLDINTARAPLCS